MGRKAEFTDRDLFAAVGMDIADGLGGTLKSVSAKTGVSVGSIYHRFGSREGLLAQAWLSAVEDFQTQFSAALRSPGAEAGLKAALVTPRFCRAHHDKAIILASCRPVEFIGSRTPADLRERIAGINAGIAGEIKDFAQEFTQKTGCSADIYRFTLIGMPLASVQMYLPQRRVPKIAEVYVERAYRALMTG